MDDNKSYCFDVALNAIYKGAPKHLLTSKESNGSVIDGWSPNNIRRLVISPDGVMVQRYITNAKCPRLIDISLFNDMYKFQSCITSMGYKPISKALSHLRVCSCVEEIIYLIGSSRGMQLPATEMQITTYHQSLKRLHSRVILPMTLQEFADKVGKKLADPAYQVCEDNTIPNKQVEIKVKDWWKHYSLRPVYYRLDSDGSNLSKYFINTQLKLDENFKSAEIKKLNDKRFGTKISKLKTSCDKLDRMLKCLLGYRKLDLKYGRASYIQAGGIELANDLYTTAVQDLRNLVVTAKIQELDGLSSTVKSFFKSHGVVYAKKEESAEIYDYHITLINNLASALYASVLKYTLTLIRLMQAKLPLVTRLMVSRTTHSLVVPPNLQSYADELKERCGLHIKPIAQGYMSSYFECYALCSALLITPSQKFTTGDSNLPVTKYSSDYWRSIGGASDANKQHA